MLGEEEGEAARVPRERLQQLGTPPEQVPAPVLLVAVLCYDIVWAEVHVTVMQWRPRTCVRSCATSACRHLLPKSTVLATPRRCTGLSPFPPLHSSFAKS